VWQSAVTCNIPRRVHQRPTAWHNIQRATVRTAYNVPQCVQHTTCQAALRQFEAALVDFVALILSSAGLSMPLTPMTPKLAVGQVSLLFGTLCQVYVAWCALHVACRRRATAVGFGRDSSAARSADCSCRASHGGMFVFYATCPCCMRMPCCMLSATLRANAMLCRSQLLWRYLEGNARPDQDDHRSAQEVPRLPERTVPQR
jgi:hypothetical protein